MPPEAPDSWSDVTELMELSRPLAPPRLKPRRDFRLLWRILLIAVLPTLLIGGYLNLIAVDRYVSEARFVIREPNAAGRIVPAGSSIADLPKGTGNENAFAVHDYVLSRDALALLERSLPLRAMLAPAAGDPLWRFPAPFASASEENLYDYYRRLVALDYDDSTNISTLHVQAFGAADAERIATILLGGAEAMLNGMNQRAHADALRVAEEEVARSRTEALAAQAALTDYRDREQLIDPLELSRTVLATITTLTEELVNTAAQLDIALHASAQSPQIPSLRSRIAALQAQIDHERGVLAGSDRSLTPRIAAYERLLMLRNFAEQRYVSALTMLETARLDAVRQAAYLERVVNPHTADQPRYPLRVLWPTVAFLVGLLICWLFRPSSIAPRPHRP